MHIQGFVWLSDNVGMFYLGIPSIDLHWSLLIPPANLDAMSVYLFSCRELSAYLRMFFYVICRACPPPPPPHLIPRLSPHVNIKSLTVCTASNRELGGGAWEHGYLRTMHYQTPQKYVLCVFCFQWSLVDIFSAGRKYIEGENKQNWQRGLTQWLYGEASTLVVVPLRLQQVDKSITLF